MKCSYSEETASGSAHDYALSSLTGCPLSHLSLHLSPGEEKPVMITRLEIKYKIDAKRLLHYCDH
jgi:hypothetical protein